MSSSGVASSFLESMLLIRRVEEKLLELFSSGVLNGTVHTCIGQESCGVGVISALNRELDIVISNHRSHGHYLAYGGPLDALFAEIMGKSLGVCKGIGGSQHLKYRNFYSNGVLGGMVPVATGMAFAAKRQNSRAIVVDFLGDGALGEGIVYEAFNIASLWSLPILYVVEANGVAQTTAIKDSLAGSISERLKAFGINTTVLDRAAPEDISEVSRQIIDRIRSKSAPECLVLHTFRLGPHSKGDDPRTKLELDKARMEDILNQMLSSLSAEERDSLETKIAERIMNALRTAEQSPLLSLTEFRESIGQ